jgi:hypothetical protein
MPAAVMAFILSAAVPWPPLMMAPAWPMRRPGGAVCPAMKPTTGFFTCCLTNSAAASSAEPPISPIMMMASVSGSSLKQAQRVDVRGADDGIAANADRGRLADAALRQLVHGLISQRAGAGDDADRTFFVNAAGHDADLGLAGRDDAGAVGADEPRLRVLELGPDLDHVERGNALGDADDERNARVLGLENGVGGKRRRNEDHGRVGAGLGHGVGHGVEDRPALVRGSALAGSDAADDVGAVFGAALGVEGAFFAGDP